MGEKGFGRESEKSEKESGKSDQIAFPTFIYTPSDVASNQCLIAQGCFPRDVVEPCGYYTNTILVCALKSH